MKTYDKGTYKVHYFRTHAISGMSIYEFDNCLKIMIRREFLDNKTDLVFYHFKISKNKLNLYVTTNINKSIRRISPQRLECIINWQMPVFNKGRKIRGIFYPHFKKFLYSWLIKKGFKLPRIKNFTNISLEQIFCLCNYTFYSQLKDKELLSMVRPCFLKSALESKDYSQFCRRLVGYNKKFLRRLVSKNFFDQEKLLTYYILRGLVIPENYRFIKSIRFHNGIRVFYLQKKIRSIRKFLRNFSKKRVEILFSKRVNLFVLDDAVRQWEEKSNHLILPKNPKSINELHDYISQEYRKLRFNKKGLKESVWWKLDNEQIGDLIVKVARTNYDLIDWGQTMNNCIAGYQNSDSTLLGLYRDNDLVYNIEISHNDIRQFYAECNRKPDKKDEKRFIEFFKKKRGEFINDQTRVIR